MMTDRNDIVKDLGWYRESPVLTDSDIDHIMLYLEENYSLTTEKKIKSAINVVAMENKYHPIQEKLNSLVWDKKSVSRMCCITFLELTEMFMFTKQ